MLSRSGDSNQVRDHESQMLKMRRFGSNGSIVFLPLVHQESGLPVKGPLISQEVRYSWPVDQASRNTAYTMGVGPRAPIKTSAYAGHNEYVIVAGHLGTG